MIRWALKYAGKYAERQFFGCEPFCVPVAKS
jgi:hypothetical protein